MNDLDIKQIRAKIGLTQAELAKKLGVDTKTVQNWESGATIPKSKYGILGVLSKETTAPSKELGFEVKDLRKMLGVTQVELAKMVGVTEATIQNWERGKKIPTTKHTTLRSLWESCAPSLKPHKYFGGESCEQLESATIVPLIPISAQGGSLNDFTASVMEYECEKVLSPIRDVDFAMTVSGDSMSPEYPSGCQVLVKRINERAFIEWGKVFVLDTINGTIIKKLMPVEGDPEKVTCVSINPEYPSFEVGFEHIRGVYRVLMCMSLK